jgi:RNA polymerase sigma-70 factor (ECF subfamily)
MSRTDAELVAALRAGDDEAFAGLVRSQHPLLHRTAMIYVSSRAVADEVVQETWLAVLAGLDGFEGRSSLRTWIFRIAANIARKRAVRESRCRPLSSLPGDDDVPGTAPVAWETPEQRLMSRETQEAICDAIAALPRAQRLVVTLRDVEGWSAEEACQALGLSAGNQRVLLHRGRTSVRAALVRHLASAGAAA